MRIAIIDPSLFTWPYDSALALALRAAGHEVALFGKPRPSQGAGPAYELLRAHFYRELDASVVQWLPRSLFLAIKGASHVWDMRRLLVELRSFRPDVIHVQWSPLPVVDRWFMSSLRGIAPLVMTVHDAVPYNGNPRSRLQGMSATAITAQFDRLIVHTKASLQRLQRSEPLPARIRCIPHGPLGDVPTGEASLRQPRDPAQRVTVLLFGQIKPYKGADVLLHAVAKLPAAIRARVQVRIVGKPLMDIAPLQALIRDAALDDCVQLEPRFVPEAEVGTLLGSADIIVMPYREIDASGVLMMALGFGLPIIATRVGLFAELLADGEHGRLIAVDDVDAFARALEELVADAAMRERMGAAARRLLAEIPGWDEIARRTVELYRELLTEGRGSAMSSHFDSAGTHGIGQREASARENIC